MSNDTTNQTTEPTPQQEGTSPQPEHAGANPNTEAAKYRRKLREAESQLEQISTQRDNLLRTIAENTIPKHIPPRLFWEHVTPVDLLGEDGTLDHDKITQAATQLSDQYGLKPSQRFVVEADGKHPAPITRNTASWMGVVQGDHV